MKHYVYTDWDGKRPTHGQIIFECDADDIMAADKLLEAAKPEFKPVAKQGSITCWSSNWGANVRDTH